MSKYGLTMSEAVQTLGKIKVPSEVCKSLKIAEAIRMGMVALEKQIDLAEQLQEFKDYPHPEQKYSESCVMEFLADVYMLSEVNDIE